MINKIIIFILLLGDTLLFECLKVNDSGVCTVKSAAKTRLRTYTVTLNKRCGKKKCTQKKTKIEKYDAAYILVCCNGWEYNNTEDICEPLCRTGCYQGLCVSPNVCQCIPPLYLDPMSNSCIRPKCNPSCVNSICVNTNNCSCDINYTPYNNTHCVPNCLPKYEVDLVTLTCKPICDIPCGNGTCVDGKCDCNDGYELFNNTCKPKCENGDCVELNKCLCHKDYIATENKTNYKSLCENCDFGQCDESNYCKCNYGYLKINNTCVPFCKDDCIHGYILLPDECNCYEEYTMHNSKICIKIVDCTENEDSFNNCTLEHEKQTVRRPFTVTQRCGKKKCTKKIYKRVNETKVVCCDGYYLDNKLCQPQCLLGCDGGRCAEPGKCECDSPLVLNNDTNACILPVCDTPCINSICQNTNECHCITGYDPVNTTHCAPVCSPGYVINPNTLNCVPTCGLDCVNGTCSAPNVCTCNAGYELKSHEPYNICSPVCDPICTNADCTAPNVCTCHEGYTETDNSSICEPECETCNHGDCVSPNECRCHVGYLNTDGVCEPICGSGCKNGHCSAPNYCTCDHGFKHSDSDNLTCIPNCDPECVNSTCKAPNICECDAGYKPKSDVINNICSPVCNPPCENADCTAPNVCTCHEGYTETDNSSICEPECKTCDHGDCVLPNECRCHVGYLNINGVCEPNCGSGCKNGYCSAPNHCICDPGFKHNDIDNLTCIPNCDPDCTNSICIAPDMCECYESYERVDRWSCKPKCNNCLNGTCSAPEVCSCDVGYIYEFGLCKPICSEMCDNGFCSSPNTCTCFDGFINGLNGCIKPCKSNCIEGTCNVLGECVCNDGHMLINDTCQPISMIDCDVCDESKCTNNICICDDGRLCQTVYVELPESAEATSPVLAVLELTGAVSLVLIILLLVVIVIIWRKRKHGQAKVVDDRHQYGSVVYTVPDTLVKQNETFLNEDINDEVFDNNINDNVEIDIYERNRSSYKKDNEEVVESGHPLLTTNNTEL